MKEFVIKRCNKCDALIKILRNCGNDSCDMTCCGEKMLTLNPNSSDGALEKHLPVYEKIGEELVVKVSHVMDSDHFIEWISLVTSEKEVMISFKPGDIPECKFEYVSNAILYSYCNKHGLWMQEIR